MNQIGIGRKRGKLNVISDEELSEITCSEEEDLIDNKMHED